MRSFTPCSIWSLVVGLPLLACGSAKTGLYDPTVSGDGFEDAANALDESGTPKAATPLAFPGAGTSGAARPLSAALAPETSSQCNPEPSASLAATSADVQTVCFFSEDSPEVPAATIEQVVEVVGTEEWVHIRLILNPDFVDNTYGDTAIGWDKDDGAEPTPPGGNAPPAPVAPAPTDAPPPADGATPAVDAPPPPAAAPPAPAAADAPPAPPAPEARPSREHDRNGAAPRPGKDGHTFKDLLGSDHAELQLLDADGQIAMHFKLDYISESAPAASGYASLGVSGGEGQLIIGQPEWILATATSLDRNLNACGLASFTENSPASDDSYTPDPNASDWDYRVSYEVWVSSQAFGSPGFGSALIENVHASPSKLDGNTVDVLPAPCPVDRDTPDATPQPVPVVLETIR